MALKNWFSLKSIIRDLFIFAILIGVISYFQTRHLDRNTVAPEELWTQTQALSGQAPLDAATSNKPFAMFVMTPWCTVCKISVPNFLNVASLGKSLGRGFAILVFDFEDETNLREKLPSDLDPEVPIIIGNDELREKLKIESYPTILFYDGEHLLDTAVAGYTTHFGVLARSLISY